MDRHLPTPISMGAGILNAAAHLLFVPGFSGTFLMDSGAVMIHVYLLLAVRGL